MIAGSPGERTVRQPLLVLAVFMLIAAGCGRGSGTGEPAASPVRITFWHSESASAGSNLAALVQRFNASQSQVVVDATYQGPPTDLALKLLAGLSADDVPALASVAEGFTQSLIDTRRTVPIQQFVDSEGYDLSPLLTPPLDYFTVDGSLRAMPYGLLVPLMYYNKVAFREAGLDPERPPGTLAEASEVSEKLVRRDAAGNTTRAGLALDVQPWFVEAMLTDAGVPLVDNGNGRDGRATAIAFEGEEARNLFRWWDGMEEAGLAINVGRNPGGAEQLIAVASGRAAMAYSSSAVMRTIVDAIAAGIEGVELGVAPLPAIQPASDGLPRGVYSRSLWIMAGRPAAEQEAAWTFIKWLLEPEQQAEWFAGSGYLPVRSDAYQQPAAREIMARYPEFRVPVELSTASAGGANPGPLLGPFPQVREAMATAMESMLSGNATADDALTAAISGANRAIADYNRRLGQ